MPAATGAFEALQQRFTSVWESHAVAGRNNVTVVAASAGHWRGGQGGGPPRTAACTTPSLWLLLVGHHRSFAWTQRHLAKVASVSSDGCAFVTALLPDEIDAPAEAATPGALGRTDSRGIREELHRQAARASGGGGGGPDSSGGGGGAGGGGDTSVAHLMRHAARTTFAQGGSSPPLAYAVVHRVGNIARYPACLPFYWHGAYALSEWVSEQHGFRPNPSAVVIRTRPDVLLLYPIRIGALRRYFETGLHGGHLMLGQAVKSERGNVAQADIHCMTSWGAYVSDIALPLEIAGSHSIPHAASGAPPGRENKLWWQRGVANGWGYGRSADEWTNQPGRFFCPLAGYHQRLGPCPTNITTRAGVAPYDPAIVDPSRFDAEDSDDGGMLRCMDRCLCLDAACKRQSCLLSVVEGIVVKTSACNTRVAYTSSALAVAAGEAQLPPRAESCVLRAALREPTLPAYGADGRSGHGGHGAHGNRTAKDGVVTAGLVSRLITASSSSHASSASYTREGLRGNRTKSSLVETVTASPIVTTTSRGLGDGGRVVPLLALPIDPLARITCYCASRTTSFAALPDLVCSSRAPDACTARHDKTRPSNTTRYGMSFYRCRRAVPLRPEGAATATGEADQGGEPDKGAALPRSNRGIWPAGCLSVGRPVSIDACVAPRKSGIR